jgi:hypothetical protein
MTSRISRSKWLLGFILAFLLSTRCASAWLRCYLPADELVQHTDSIVIGHVDGSFTPLEIPKGNLGSIVPKDFRFMEYRTTLVITEVLAGKMPVGPTPLLLHYGIRPVVLEAKPTAQDMFNPPAADQNTGPNTPVGIYDSATTCIGGPPSDDIRKDHIWFLRAKASSVGGVNEDTDAPGIWSPQDVQPLDQKAYYEAVLAGDPTGLAPFTVGDSWQAQQARLTQSRMKVEKIAQNPDLSTRCDQLMPIFLNKEPAHNFAFDTIVATGSVGAAKLVPVFQSADGDDIGTIIGGWRTANYKESIPLITDFLRKEFFWWSSKSKEDRIYASREGPKGGEPFNDPRSISFRNIFSAVEVLDDFHATEAKGVIEQTRAQWADAVPFLSNNDLLKTCDDALADLR